MSDYMLLEYLKGRGKHDEDRELIEDFKHYMRAKGKMKGSKRFKDYEWEDMYDHYDTDDYMDHHKYGGYLHDSMMKEIFTEHEAKELVSEMYHYEGDKKVSGEHFTMHKAEEVYEKYKGHFMVKASICEVYIAINAFYHDFVNLLKTWFGSTLDEKIIMLAITFWFKDEDHHGNKLMGYFS